MMNSIKLYFISKLGKWVLFLLYNTNKWNIEGEEKYIKLIEQGQSVIISIWHGRVLTFVKQLAYKKYYAVAGTHNDAEIIARICINMGWKVIRGSSSDKGREAYEAILDALNEPGSLIAMTPDGPKGPAKIPKAGIVKAAQRTGAIIIPAAAHSTKRWGFTNWDTFYVAKPFGRIEVIYGDPISFSKEDQFVDCLAKVKEAMDMLESEVNRRVGL
jgi:hypothetical protein